MYKTAQDVITEMRNFIDRRFQLDDAIALLAAAYVTNYMKTNELALLKVDDEHEIPGYAVDEFDEVIEDDDLNQAVGWLPSTVFSYVGPFQNQPALEIGPLEAFLAGGEQK